MPTMPSGWVVANGSTWTQWNSTYATYSTTATANEVIWQNAWTTTGVYTAGVIYTTAAQGWDAQPAIVEDEHDWEAEAAAARERERERNRIHAAAISAASVLLELLLTEEQKDDLLNRRYFEVVGASGQLWRIHFGSAGNVSAINEHGQELMAICAHPQLRSHDGYGYLPTADVMAAQALHLMHDDVEFLRTANIHRGRNNLDNLVPALRAA